MEFFQSLDYWHWWILAVVLLIGEALIGGALLVWFAAGALVVGIYLMALPLSWQVQLVLFSLVSVVSAVAWRAFRRMKPDTSDHPRLNKRTDQYIGRTTALVEPIVNGTGKIIVDDSMWKVRGPDLPQGAPVRVTSADGSVLIVERA